MALTGAGTLGAAVSKAGQTSSSQIRTGMVVDYSETAISVRFAGGDVADFPYVRNYNPIIGEQVILAANGSAWIVIDGLAGMPPFGLPTADVPSANPVTNGGFEGGGGSVTGWGKVDFAGATTLAVAFADPPIEGVACGEVSSATVNVNTVVYSGAIPVGVGQRWSADCYLRTGAPSSGSSVIASLMLTWYANDTNVYPTTVASDTVVSFQEMPAPQNIWSLFKPFPGTTAGYAVPAGATHMRVAVQHLTSDATQVASLFIDRVVARRIDLFG